MFSVICFLSQGKTDPAQRFVGLLLVCDKKNLIQKPNKLGANIFLVVQDCVDINLHKKIVLEPLISGFIFF